MRKVTETIAIEFYVGGMNGVEVLYNGRKINLKKFIQMAAYDSDAAQVIRYIQKKIDEDGFWGGIEAFIVYHFANKNDRLDILIKDGKTDHRGKHTPGPVVLDPDEYYYRTRHLRKLKTTNVPHKEY